MDVLTRIGIAAFRAGKYHDAIEILLQATDIDPNDYMAKLYLAMSYQKAGRMLDAQRLLKRLSACMDLDVAQKASAALIIVEAEVRQRYSLESVQSSLEGLSRIPKSNANSVVNINQGAKRYLLDEDIAWVG